MPEDVLAAIDARTRRVGPALAEYLRRALERERVDDDRLSRARAR